MTNHDEAQAETTSTAAAKAATVLYRERQWVPVYWWVLAAFVVALLTAQMGANRSLWWTYIPGFVFAFLAVWILLSLSSTRITVEEDPDGTRWLLTGQAQLPHDVVSRSLAVPANAKRNAMGRQLDPAAFVVSHGWIPEMVMLVLDDPEDPTPYWLVGSKNPEKLLGAFLPDQVDAATAHFHDED